MFNALNRFISRLDGDTPQQRQQERGSFGFQVLRNTNLELAVEPWFDFIVGINGRPIDNPEPALFSQEVRNCAGSTVTLGLWNAKGQRTREMHVPVPVDTASLGLSLQYSPLSLAANIWHVLDVPANSPADVAGLLPYGDYILGSPEGPLYGEGGLGELVEDFIGRPMRLYVYNNEYNVTREVTIQPSRDWGGQGALGCVLGYGALHRLPAPLSEPVDAPGETMFDGGLNEKSEGIFVPVAAADIPPPPPAGDYLVPAQMIETPHVGAPPKGGKKKERHGHSPNRLMDDYFKEEEEKSRSLDNAPTGRASPMPPPPKAGGPPKAEPKAETESGGRVDE
ncbi:GRASP55/65 PDZ-like domain-containing protein [Dactylonectria macrodidyma]|uniref:GRASP55/65 PDZ-like domain-containing protein n=1 Tax=Dactylonectria macrodidyma TaxID=307937 RepID=A0A9P9FQE7_9HYPO|nr:GRASP55/65 PDZ-like domain-containing protein [Dactylonectria macrodidyma]